MTRTVVFLFFMSFALGSFGQNTTKSFTVKYITNSNIVADGILDEAVWEKAETTSNFWQYFPIDSVLAQQQTEVKFLFDDKNLYVGLKLYAAGTNYAIESLRRDFRAGNSDNITLLFDTFNDGTNAFIFGTNPYGVRREGLLSGGGSNGGRDFNFAWDIKWKGDAKIYDGYYTSEMIIPLSSVKFREGETKWRFNLYRFDTQSNEQSTWIRIPQNQPIFNMAFMGDMVFEKPLGQSKKPIAIIPYINTLAQKDFVLDETTTNIKIGGDAKIAIGNSLNLDVTFNPDFSNVQVDNVIVNLTRFEVSLPERRQFFIDNSDLFGSFGGQRDANPFFSRRIGIARDLDGNSIENNIIAGARLSGKLSNSLRLGLLNVQTERDSENGIPSNNNAVLAIQQKVFSRSNIGAFIINRQALGDLDSLTQQDRFNRVVGIDYNLASKDNVWNGKFYAHKSFESDDNKFGNELSTGANLRYNSKKWNVFTDWVYIGKDFRSDLGFIPRTDIFTGLIGFERQYWPKKGIINRHSFDFFPFVTWRPGLDFQNTDRNFRLGWNARFNNQSQFNAGISNRFTFLSNSFDPTSTEGATPLPGDVGYTFTEFQVNYRSDRRKIFSYNLNSSLGQFFNGQRYSLRANGSLRLQPKVFLSLNVNYNRIELPDPFPSGDIWLISPRVDVTFNKTLFWSTLIQFSDQSDNLGINSRLQWRFAPLSDLFIVYNDNYFVDNFQPRNRSINLRLTYWLNI